MAIHVAQICIIPISPSGSVLTPGSDYTVQQRMNASSEPRILLDAAIPNSANYPNIPTYLIAEDASGYNLLHMDQTYIITSNSAGTDFTIND